jgi:dTDP-4-amino-4,6-dideoxygalactose transaminase
VSEVAGDNVVSLPLHPGLSDDELQRVVGVCRQVLEEAP